jgi:hypothetical protein
MAQLMKEYTLKELEELSKNYSLVSVQDTNGKKVNNWTPSTKSIKQHFAECVKRLNMEVNPDGFYYFCFALNRRNSTDNYDKYLYKKGNPKPEVLNDNNTSNYQDKDKNGLITVTAALEYITKIANLTVEVNTLKAEVQRLKDENAVLTADLESLENEEGLNEGKPEPILEYLKETAPSIMALADRFFEHQDKKLSLEQQKIDKGIFATPNKISRPKPQVKTFEPGSDEHLNFIRLLYANKKEIELNKELDKLETANPEKYQLIGEELNLFEDETNND